MNSGKETEIQPITYLRGCVIETTESAIKLVACKVLNDKVDERCNAFCQEAVQLTIRQHAGRRLSGNKLLRFCKRPEVQAEIVKHFFLGMDPHDVRWSEYSLDSTQKWPVVHVTAGTMEAITRGLIGIGGPGMLGRGDIFDSL